MTFIGKRQIIRSRAGSGKRNGAVADGILAGIQAGLYSLTPWGAMGWAWLPAEPGRHVEVEAVLDGEVIGRTIAALTPPDMAANGLGEGQCGFSLGFHQAITGPIPPSIQLRLDGHSAVVSNRTWSTLEGYVDEITVWGATGWAWMPAAENIAVTIEARIGHRVVGRAVACSMRHDISASGRGDGLCGFELTFDEPIAPTDQLAFTAIAPDGTTALIPHCQMSEIVGYVDGITRHSAVGWAWRPATPNTPLAIEAILDGIVIGSTTADTYLHHLASSGRGTGEYGFEIKFDRWISGNTAPTIKATFENRDFALPGASDLGPDEKPAETPRKRPRTAAPEATSRAGQIAALKNSGLFDEAFYLQTYPDLAGADIPLIEHFFEFGYREGRRPNPYFEPTWYLEQTPDIAGAQPLLHFLQHGDAHGHNPGPLFDVTWYRERYGIPASENTLAHYLRLRFEKPLSPVPDFDADFYAAHNPDLVAAKVDMFDHFFSYGYRECRNPSAAFDVKFYVQRYLKGDFSQNPFIHFWAHRHEPGILGRMPDDEVTVSREVKRFCRPGPYFEEIQGSGPPLNPQAMVLAYYLPQFHAFPENDTWWGRGFTEWTNVIRGSPRFIGHYQPRVPRDLGFYTLDTNETMRAQIKLALAGGVSGFVFYYYWFNGKRLMDQPIRRFLADPTLNIQFALMWANENWTRRWDGAESEVLISQDYHANDDIAMAAEFAEHFSDSRYIRLQGRALLMIYRPGIIPNVKQAIARWREMFRKNFNEDPIFVMAQAFGAENPREFGFDGAIEFPPHKLTTHMAPVNTQFTYLDADFAGNIHHYDDVAAISLGEPFPDFPLIKTAIPSWDNDSRRQGTGMAITGSTPPKYEAWLAGLVDIARKNPFYGESIVCVNAWNEWCEGAYLEPDLHFGGAYLNATARAVGGRARSIPVPRLILIGHDAFAGGAQHLLLNIGRVLHTQFGIEFEYLLLGGGDMAAAYAEHGPTTIIVSDAHLSEKLRTLAEAGFSGAIVNTSAAARATAYLREAGIRPVLLMHELPRILREKHLIEHARLGLDQAESIVFSAPFVRDAVLRELDIANDDRILIEPQGSYKEIHFDPVGAAEIRRDFCLGDADHLVIGVGYADMRKGFDLFLHLWRLLQNAQTTGRIVLVWVGGIDPGLADWLEQEIAHAKSTATFHMAGYRNDVAALFSAAGAFALTSREDPLPTVVMEALSAGCPVAAFDRSGGAPDMLRAIDEGMIVPYGDVAAMAQAILSQLVTGITQAQREARHAKIKKSFDFAAYVGKLLKLALPRLAEVSVAVPNYNYARYMAARLGSIFQQTYPIHELLVLDDCSTDDSLKIIPQIARASNRAIRLIPNEKNSGSVFVQWRRAAELATGEYIWIAEADDLSDSDFLSRATSLLSQDQAVKFVFTDSRTIDVEGNAQWDSYKPYYSTVEPGALTATAIFDAADFVARFLAVKNLILNVSAVVWRRDALLAALQACQADLQKFRMAGDWLLYLTALSAPGARIGYDTRPCNIHRRHATSVTHALAADRHLAEIAACHTVAATFFPLPPEVLANQQSYLTEVSDQLGATPPPPQPAPKKRRRPAKPL